MKSENIAIIIGVCFSVIFIFLVIFMSKKIEKLKQTDKFQKALQEKIIYNKSASYYKNKDCHFKFDINFPEVYKPNLNIRSIILFVGFIIFGFIMTAINFYLKFSDKNILKFFPLIFSCFGILLLIQFLTTKYILDKENLTVLFSKNKYVISYSNILEITKETINMGYKHGLRKGRIRAETNSKVLFITFINDKTVKKVIMISPKKEEEFIGNILKILCGINCKK